MIQNYIQQIYEQKPLSYRPEHYHQILKEIRAQEISPQIMYLLKRNGQFESSPLFFQVGLMEDSKPVLYQNLFIKNQTKKIFDKLEQLAIEVISVKGVYFGEKYFGHPGARATSDIDLLVKEEEVEKVVQVVKSIGFDIEEERIENHFHMSLSKNIPGSPVPLVVEIHWNLMNESNTHLNPIEFFVEAEPLEGYTHVKNLSPLHTFYFMCLHAWRHNLDSTRHYLDLIQIIFLSHQQISTDALMSMARKHSTLKRMLRTLSEVYDQFPMLESLMPFPELTTPWYKKKRHHPLTSYLIFFDYQFLSYDAFHHRLREIGRWLVPNGRNVGKQLKQEESSILILNYIRLYRQRISSVLKAFL
ncbi:nucleotidyltransferase family protein [Halobacillus sp. BBL2006]|uniref:nucleotidyltransferase family protein n=1 Tax=Halobacillus sp. BBL2006 TaxID=1543706 RepID=UPI00068E5E1F|nr:nucleotidyltransferase family protein [Halobacillus sp. BBL2006]